LAMGKVLHTLRIRHAHCGHVRLLRSFHAVSGSACTPMRQARKTPRCRRSQAIPTRHLCSTRAVRPRTPTSPL
jgi:hypothetical protein